MDDDDYADGTDGSKDGDEDEVEAIRMYVNSDMDGESSGGGSIEVNDI